MSDPPGSPRTPEVPGQPEGADPSGPPDASAPAAACDTANGPDFATTIRVRDACLCLQVQRAARALARRFDDAFRPVGLTSGQFSLLMALNRPDPPTMGQVASVLAMDRTTLTANLKPLEKQGLLAVVPDAGDRRVRRLALTEAGRAALRRALPTWEATQAALHAALGEGEAESLCRALGRLT